MNKRTTVLIAIALCAVAGAFGWPAEEMELVKMFDRYAGAVNTGNFDAWISLWDDEGIQLPYDEPPHAGKDAILAANAEGFRMFEFNMWIKCQEVKVLGEFGYVRGLYGYAANPRGGSGGGVTVDGKFLTVFRKQPDGSWRIYRDIFNTNTPAI